MRGSATAHTGLLAAILVIGALTTPSMAAAYGEFRVESGAEIERTGTRILLAENADGTVTTVIEPRLTTDATEVAWLIPVRGEPEVALASSTAFDRLEHLTNRSYVLNQTIDGRCSDSESARGCIPEDESCGPEPPALSTLQVGGFAPTHNAGEGPFEQTIISATDSPRPVEAVMDWLADQGFDQAHVSEEVLGTYIASGNDILAVQVRAGTDVSALRPLRVTSEADDVVLPLSVGATESGSSTRDVVWVLGDDRAAPIGMPLVELNPTAINWMDPTRNYSEVFDHAIAEAGGQAFATDFAGRLDEVVALPNWTTEAFDEAIVSADDADAWSRIEDEDWTSRADELIGASARFAEWDGFEDVVDDHFPLTDDMSAREFAACVECRAATIPGDLQDFDTEAFVDALGAQVYRPMVQMQRMLNRSVYMTRLSTKMSTQDAPLEVRFTFDVPQLGDISPMRSAEIVRYCSRDIAMDEAPWELEMDDGTIIHGEGAAWPIDAAEDAPAAQRAVEYDNEGNPTVVLDQTDAVDEAVSSSNGQFVGDEPRSGCSTGHGRAPGATSLVWLLVLLASRRLTGQRRALESDRPLR